MIKNFDEIHKQKLKSSIFCDFYFLNKEKLQFINSQKITLST